MPVPDEVPPRLDGLHEDGQDRQQPLADLVRRAPTLAEEVVFRGRIFDIRRDTVVLPSGPVERDYLTHPGACAVVAMDDQERILLIRQYRHPIGRHEWELPAGLLDVAGEDPLTCAQRELAEEVDLVAAHWQPLLRYYSSPGGTDEELHLFVATGLSPVPPEQRHVRTDEEAGMPRRWVPLDELRAAVLAGTVRNAALLIATLALSVSHPQVVPARPHTAGSRLEKRP